MAIARALCICKNCKEQFFVQRHCDNRKRADDWESWAPSFYTLCSNCRDKQWQLKIKLLNEHAAKHAKDQNLIPLSGSEKQIAWANTIREQKLKEVQETQEFLFEAMDELKALESVSPQLKEVLENAKVVFLKFLEHYANETVAANWIDRRSVLVISLLCSGLHNLLALKHQDLTQAEFFAWAFSMYLNSVDLNLERAQKYLALHKENLGPTFQDLFDNPHVRAYEIEDWAPF